MIREPIDATVLRLKDVLRRRERELPVLDDEAEILQHALDAIESLRAGLRMREAG